MKKVMVCVNVRHNPQQPSCGQRGSLALADCLEQEISHCQWNLQVQRVDCLGECMSGPNVKLSPAGPLINHASVDHLATLLEAIEHFDQETPPSN